MVQINLWVGTEIDKASIKSKISKAFIVSIRPWKFHMICLATIETSIDSFIIKPLFIIINN